MVCAMVGAPTEVVVAVDGAVHAQLIQDRHHLLPLGEGAHWRRGSGVQRVPGVRVSGGQGSGVGDA